MFLLCLLFWQGPPKTHTLFFIDQSKVTIYEPLSLEMHMFVFQNEKGQKTYVSKAMVDWDLTAEANLEVLAFVYPEKAKTWQPRKKDNYRKNIRIDNKTLKKSSEQQKKDR